MYRCCGMDVVERENIGVLIHFLAGNFFSYDFAENTVFHIIPFFVMLFHRSRKFLPGAAIHSAHRPALTHGRPIIPGSETTNLPFHVQYAVYHRLSRPTKSLSLPPKPF